MVRAVAEHVHRIGLGFVSAFVIVLPEGLTLVDAGVQNSPPPRSRSPGGGRR